MEKSVGERSATASRQRLAQLARAHKLAPGRYRIDAAGTVSKYIGETEKTIGATLFVVDTHGAVLLLDEADALMGKRSEVKDAHDRYANTDTVSLEPNGG